jgi:hypothetical protein
LGVDLELDESVLVDHGIDALPRPETFIILVFSPDGLGWWMRPGGTHGHRSDYRPAATPG